MKKMIYLSLLLIAPLLAFSSPLDVTYEADGIWYNHDYDLKLRVKQSNRKITVRGLFTNDWIKFKHLYGNTYGCSRGSLLTVDYRDDLVYRKKRNARPVRFTRNNSPSYDTGGGGCEIGINSGYGNNQNYDDGYHHNYNKGPVAHPKNSRRAIKYYKYRSPRSIKRKLDGRWKTPNGRKIKIQTTSTGIRATLKNIGGWNRYEQGHFANEFISDKGTYILDERGRLRFYKNNGEVIKLRRA